MNPSPKQYPIRDPKPTPSERCVCGCLKVSHGKMEDPECKGPCRICQCPDYEEIGIMTNAEYRQLLRSSST